MQDTNHFLRAAFQIGPWRITRKVFLFVIAFCVVVILFSTIVFKTHMFDEDWEDWDDDDDWDEGVSAGDALLLVIIGLAGIGALVSSVGCCLASFNSPEQLTDTGSVFTLSGMTQSTPVASAPQAVSRIPRQSRRSQSSDNPKANPPITDYPQGPSYPINPGYPPAPPPYSAPSYPPGGVPTAGPPPGHTLSDLPPPYAPGHYPTPPR